MLLVAACRPSSPGPVVAPPGPPTSPQPTASAPTAPPPSTLSSLDEAAQAGARAVGQLLSVSARVSGVDEEGIRIEVCDAKKAHLIVRVPGPLRAKVRGALASMETCTPWVVRLDEPVVPPDPARFGPWDWTTATAVDLPAAPALPEPSPGVAVMPTELALGGVESDSRYRKGGTFWWRQLYNAVGSGNTMVYGVMFDEVDEGTAMFKLAPSADAAPAQGTS